MPERILYVNGNPMARGGIEAFMMNYYRHFDKDKLQVDFLVHGYEKGAYTDEIEAMGGRIYPVPYKGKHPIRYQRELKKILGSGEHVLIHSHIDAMNCWVLKVAKECGIPVRISHSHNTYHLTSNPIKLWLNEYARKHVADYATHLFACSDAAGKWLYQDRWNGKQSKIINNAIDLQKFAYDGDVAEGLRKQYGLEDACVIGHVGRFSDQKNHMFLLESFAKALAENDKLHLVLIGIGENMEMAKSKIETLQIGQHVHMLGAISDTSPYYNMFDMFILPSLFEGLPVVALEAQANGLDCLLSDTITKEIALTDKIQFYSITDTELWKQALLQEADNIFEQKEQGLYKEKRSVEQSKKLQAYDITHAALELQTLYLDLIEEARG